MEDEEIKRLHKALKYVPETAVAAEAESEKFPQDWLFHVRWNGPKKSPKLDGNAVEFLKVGGRVSCLGLCHLCCSFFAGSFFAVMVPFLSRNQPQM